MTDPQTAIYSLSDDLIEIKGNVDKELPANYGEPTYVQVGQWTFEVEYDTDGIWRVDVLNQPDGFGCQKYEPGELDDYRDYTEVVKFVTEESASVEKLDSYDEDGETTTHAGKFVCQECGETVTMEEPTPPWGCVYCGERMVPADKSEVAPLDELRALVDEFERKEWHAQANRIKELIEQYE